jgi:uncharacterized membrane protein YphA (DoxX/SURF4 family)
VEWFALLCTLAVGAVFVVAGASKVASGSAWRADADALGAPGAVATLVPYWELAIGALLIVGLLTPWAALAALVTLAGFTAALVRVLRRGEHPRCACFGVWSAAPVTWRNVWRNVALMGLALISALVA